MAFVYFGIMCCLYIFHFLVLTGHSFYEICRRFYVANVTFTQ